MKRIYWVLLLCSTMLLVACDKIKTSDISGLLEFKLNGEDLMVVNLGENFEDPGVHVKYWGKDVSSEVKVEGAVNTAEVGYYTLQYTFLNRDGIPTYASRVVIVADPKVSIDLSGKYSVQEGTHRLYAGAQRDFSGPVVTIERIAPGFFSVSDLFAGYYDQFLKRNTASQRMSGYVELKADNTLKLHKSFVPQWGDSLHGFSEATYNPEKGEIRYQATYVEGKMIFNVILKK
ncbi:MAG: DUF5012 domain-containing protein [Porphyromonadaceae bacterium]|nr:DUF5012 domain-containing protein [Porphyromonadaceae bacterium]